TCSPPRRRGSIAAACNADKRGALLVLPSSKEGLHCGVVVALALDGHVGVLPSSKEGLHCGGLRPLRSSSRRERCSPPRRRGSIAADGPAPVARALAQCSPP